MEIIGAKISGKIGRAFLETFDGWSFMLMEGDVKPRLLTADGHNLLVRGDAELTFVSRKDLYLERIIELLNLDIRRYQALIHMAAGLDSSKSEKVRQANMASLANFMDDDSIIYFLKNRFSPSHETIDIHGAILMARKSGLPSVQSLYENVLG